GRDRLAELPRQLAGGIELALINLRADRMNGCDHRFTARGNRLGHLGSCRHGKHQMQRESESDDNHHFADEWPVLAAYASEEFYAGLSAQDERFAAVTINIDNSVAKPPDRIDLHCALHSSWAGWMRLAAAKGFEPRLICP